MAICTLSINKKIVGYFERHSIKQFICGKRFRSASVSGLYAAARDVNANFLFIRVTYQRPANIHWINIVIVLPNDAPSMVLVYFDLVSFLSLLNSYYQLICGNWN